MKKKEFDCVEMKRRIQAEIQAETKGMSADELLAYFRAATEDDSPLARKVRGLPRSTGRRAVASRS